jgi:hypothetical protein
VRAKLAHLVRARWFEAPFSGIGFSRLIAEALDQMAASERSPRLLPHMHPLDLFTTATDCTGYVQRIAPQPDLGGGTRAPRFHRFSRADRGGPMGLPARTGLCRARHGQLSRRLPPLQVAEIDAMMADRGQDWSGRDTFLARIMPAHAAQGDMHKAALMDGSVLVNAPFGPAIAALSACPAEVEVDRRLVYVDPTQTGPLHHEEEGAPGFFPVIFRAISTIPREQPIRDNLESLARQSATLQHAHAIATGIAGEVNKAVRQVLGEEILSARPDARQLGAWRAAAQRAAAQQAGYAYHAYALYKLEATLDQIAATAGFPRDGLGRWARANLRLTPSSGVGLSGN